MTIADKLQEVSHYASEGKLLLYSEGMFWKAYQEAAYLFVKNIKPYQVNSSYIKKVQTDVLSLGFPKPSTSKILSAFDFEEISDRIVISFPSVIFNEVDYLLWRNEVVPQPLPCKRPAGDSLLVYKHAYDLVLYFYQLNHNVSREYKFSLCEKIKDELHEILMNIYFANDEKDNSLRIEMIKKSVRLLQSVKLRVRLLHDLKQLNLNHFAHLAELFTDLKTELLNWEKSQQCSR
jgi:hypothetical protein